MLGSDGDDADRAAWATVYGTAAQVQGVFAELAVDEDVVSGEGDFTSFSRRAVSRMSAARISVVEAVAWGSTPPAWATLTTRSRSRMVSEKTMGWMESSGRAKWSPRRVKYTPPIVGRSASAGVRKPLVNST